MLKFSSLLVATVFCLATEPVSSQAIIPNTTFFPDLQKSEIQNCARQAEAYGLIARMRDSKIPAETAVQKLVIENKMKPETALIVVDSVYKYDATTERIIGQVLGECLTALSYEKLIRRSKFI